MANKAKVYISGAYLDVTPNKLKQDVIDKLRAEDYDVFSDQDIQGVNNWDKILFEELVKRDVIISLIGEEGLWRSNWVARELDMARAGGTGILPIIIDPNVSIQDVKERFWLQDAFIQVFKPLDEMLEQLPSMIDSLAKQTQENRQQRALAQNTEVSEILGLVSTDEQFQCDVFMVMPFRDHLNPIYDDLIKPLVEGMGLTIKRGDVTFSEQDIMEEVWSMINNCSIVIADCTDQNPNVFYEMGLAHAIGKSVIPITQKIEDIPFDIRQKRFIPYENTISGGVKLKNEIKNAIEILLANN